MFTGIKERGKLLFVLLFSAACFLNACGGGGGGDGGGPTPADIEDMQGVWNGVTTTQEYGEEQTTFNLTQDGANIAGSLQCTDSSGTYETDNLTGSVDGSTVSISAIFPFTGGGELEYGYVGTVSNNTYNGNVDLYINGNIHEQGGTFTVIKDNDGGDDGNDGNGLAAPTLISPTAGAHCWTNLVFKWSAVPDATIYRVYVIDAKDKIHVAHLDARGICDASICFTGTSQLVSADLPDGLTRWQVQSCDATHCGPTSTLGMFTLARRFC